MKFTVSCFGLFFFATFAFADDFDSAPIKYATAQANNAITELQQKIKDKKVKLTQDEEFGFLKSLLKELDIPKSSQMLVFSKTSLQRHRITPKTPRAIYFNDTVSVGYIRGSEMLEITAADPNLGVAFYTLSEDSISQPRFTRQTDTCLVCHSSSRNNNFPGHLIRSVFPDKNGELVLSQGSKKVDYTTPIEDRWGGWYVTGTSGKQKHLGNQIVGGWPWAKDDSQNNGTNVVDLKPYFTVANSLTIHSDIVALMVLEHQSEVHNRLTKANFQTRIALHEQAELNKAFGDGKTFPSDSIPKRIQWACEPVVLSFLFCEETILTDPVVGTSDFAKEFSTKGPFDKQKRTLREFDLKKRMFRYPLSYTIYSPLFEGLPKEAKEQIFKRLWEVLSGKDKAKEFSHLSETDRKTLIEIARDTVPGLPDYWK